MSRDEAAEAALIEVSRLQRQAMFRLNEQELDAYWAAMVRCPPSNKETERDTLEAD